MRIPSFSDAPTDVLEQFEGVFAERKDDAEFDGDSGYHEGEHEIQVNRGWGLVGAVCLVVELITAIGVHFVPDQVMREETRMFVSAVGFIAFVVTIWVVMGIRRVWSARRIALLGSVRFVTPLRKQKLAMGEVLQGQISLALKKPLENCSLGLSLVLLHGTKYSSDNDEDVCLGTSGPIEYRPLCRNTAFRLRNVNLEADSAEVWDFMIPTPQHNPEHVEVPGLFESTLIGGRNSRNYSMAKLLSQEGLRRQRRKHRLVWSQTAELMGPLGVALRRKIQLRVT